MKLRTGKITDSPRVPERVVSYPIPIYKSDIVSEFIEEVTVMTTALNGLTDHRVHLHLILEIYEYIDDHLDAVIRSPRLAKFIPVLREKTTQNFADCSGMAMKYAKDPDCRETMGLLAKRMISVLAKLGQ
jgi:acyl carrier protein phosphodiesterase